MLVPDAQVGAVISTNSDEGQMLLRPFMRRLLEVLYDGKPEAAGDVTAAARRMKAEFAAERLRLKVPPAADATEKLAARYSNPDLGQMSVLRVGGAVRFQFPEWGADMASRKNDDGTLSFVSVTPTLIGFEFVVGEKGGIRTLTIRYGQHEYIYAEAKGAVR